MIGYILGLGTAIPEHVITQDEALRKMREIFPSDIKQSELIDRLILNSGIQKRHIVIPDFTKNRSEWHFWGYDYPKTIPGMTQRNEVYKKEGPLLAHEAAQKAIQAWGGDPSMITHVIAVSCTGVVIPGIDFHLINSLNLKRSTRRLGVNFMGCFGAFKGLEVAHAFAKENSNHRILIVCMELCSLHLQANQSTDSILGSTLFADGAAAVIVGSDPKANEFPLWSIVKHSSCVLENSLSLMGWEASDQGFLMRLSPSVSLNIAKHIQPFAESLLSSYAGISACNWAIHPGGKAILQVIEKKLKLEKWQTTASWNVLENYGNMSSSTFLFVLSALSQQLTSKDWTVGIGFGPGLSIEGLLLQKV